MTKRALALHLLREAGDRGITTAEFLKAGVGSRYSARILELRQLGHVIESTPIREGSWRYRLTHDAEGRRGTPTPATGIPAASSLGAVGGAGDSNPESLSASVAQDAGKLFELPHQPKSAALHDHEEVA